MWYLLFLFILGMAVGSFLNVCIYRLPRRESIIYPVSHCPQCGQSLKRLDLIPILGYFLLGGKCRYCKTRISFRYPLVEFATGAFFVWTALLFPLESTPLNFGFSIIFVLLSIIIFFIDLEEQVIPDAISVSGIFFGLCFNYLKALFYPKPGALSPFFSSLFGMFLGYLLLYLIGKLGKFWLKKEALGEGDLYFAAMLGAWLGWEGLLLSLFLAYLMAGLVALIFLAGRKIKFGDYIPFGPALAGGGVITLFFGQQIMAWYLGWFVR